MKKILFLLLSTVAMYGQVPADATPLENIQITNNTTSTTATKVNVQENDGTINTKPLSELANYLEFASAVNLPVTGEQGKLYLTKDNNRLYRFNGAIYQELTTDISGLQAQIDLKANDSEVIHLTRNETKTGGLDIVGKMSSTVLSVGAQTLISSLTSPNLPNSLEQGYTFDGTSHYLFGSSQISKRNDSWGEIVGNTNALAGITGVNHLGDGVYLEGFLYAPVESYPAVTGMQIAKYDANTLSLVTTYDISAQGHEASSITTDGTILYVSSYNDGTKIWKYSTTGSFLGVINITDPFTDNIQGISFYNNEIYVVEQSKLSKIDISGATSAFLGGLPGVIHHRGTGIQVVNGVARIPIVNDTSSFVNVHYFDGTTETGSDKFIVDGSGNTYIQGKLGVGVPSTNLPVEIVGSTATDQLMMLQNKNPNGASSLVFKDNGGTRFLTVGVTNTTSSMGSPDTFGTPGEALIRASINTTGLFIQSAGGATRFGQGSVGAEAMRIDTGRRLLVGTTSSTAGKMEVVGSDNGDRLSILQNTNSAGLSGHLYKNNLGSSFLTVGVNNSASTLDATYGVSNEGLIRSSASSAGIFLSAASGNIRFATAQGLERMRISTGGRLLIGGVTDNGVDRLQVNGTVTASPATLSNHVVVKSQLDAVASSGSYTPGVTLLFNTTSATVQTATWTKVGNIVTVMVNFSVVPTAQNVNTNFSITLPISRTTSIPRALGSGTVINPDTIRRAYPVSIFSENNTTARIDFLPVSFANGFVGCSAIIQYSVLD